MLASTILHNNLLPSEIGDIAKLLVKYRKSGIGWDEWKTKHFPEVLIEKWNQCLDECYKNGFIGPHVWADDIKFYQVLGRANQNTDQCTMCPNKFDLGECKYRTKDGIFEPCWLKEE